MGMVAHEYGHEEEALRWYDRMGKKYVKSPQVMFCHEVRHARGRTKEALKLLDDTIHADPELLNLAAAGFETLERSGELQAARAHATKYPEILEHSHVS